MALWRSVIRSPRPGAAGLLPLRATFAHVRAMSTGWAARLGESAGRAVTRSYLIDLVNPAIQAWLLCLDTGRLPGAIRMGKNIVPASAMNGRHVNVRPDKNVYVV